MQGDYVLGASPRPTQGGRRGGAGDATVVGAPGLSRSSRLARRSRPVTGRPVRNESGGVEARSGSPAAQSRAAEPMVDLGGLRRQLTQLWETVSVLREEKNSVARRELAALTKARQAERQLREHERQALSASYRASRSCQG